MYNTAPIHALHPQIRILRTGLSVEGRDIQIKEDERLELRTHSDWQVFAMIAVAGFITLLLAGVMIWAASPLFLYAIVFAIGAALLVGSLVGLSRRESYYELVISAPGRHPVSAAITRSPEPLRHAIRTFERQRSERISAAQVEHATPATRTAREERWEDAPGTMHADVKLQQLVGELLELPLALRMGLARTLAASAAIRLDPAARAGFLRDLARDLDRAAGGEEPYDLRPGPH